MSKQGMMPAPEAPRDKAEEPWASLYNGYHGAMTRPQYLPGGTHFSRDPVLADPIWLIEKIKQTPLIWDDLKAATDLSINWARRRNPGHWALAYLTFVISGAADVQPWWSQTTPDLWKAAGFDGKPPYSTVHQRFAELEGDEENQVESRERFFREAAGKLVRLARVHEPRIGAHVHVDGTEAQTHATLAHDCRKDDNCSDWDPDRGRLKRRGTKISKATLEAVREARHKEAEEAPTDESDGIAVGPGVGESESLGKTRRVKIGEHWFRTLDKSAGTRAYKRGGKLLRFWHGFYNIKATDHLTGAALTVGVFSAARNEHLLYPEVYDMLVDATGVAPQTVMADRGFSVASVYEHNTSRGVATVSPDRPGGNEKVIHDAERWDRHGIPRCKHCGAPGRFVRFAHKPKPRLWFRCTLPHTTECKKQTQTIRCEEAWLRLVPLWRTTVLYQTLAASHSRYERVHKHWRDRYRVGADNLTVRPKRRGRECQQLRASAALLIEWLRICVRQGWLDEQAVLGDPVQNAAERCDTEGLGDMKKMRGISGAHSMHWKRMYETGLAFWYGEQAHKLNLTSSPKPPSRTGDDRGWSMEGEPGYFDESEDDMPGNDG